MDTVTEAQMAIAMALEGTSQGFGGGGRFRSSGLNLSGLASGRGHLL